MDPKAMYNMMFGGGRFEAFVGDLSEGAMATVMTDDEMERAAAELQEKLEGKTPEEAQALIDEFQKMHQARMAEKQAEQEKLREERVNQLREQLLARLKTWQSDPESLKKEAHDLIVEDYGYELIHTIGYIYYHKARIYLGKQKFLGIPGLFRSAKDAVHMVKEMGSAARATIGAGIKQQEFAQIQQMAEQQGESMSLDQFEEMQQEMGTQMKKLMWAFNRVEISSMLRSVCDKVLNDPACTEKNELKERAKLLEKLGDFYYRMKPTGELNGTSDANGTSAAAASAADGEAKNETLEGKGKGKGKGKKK
jgi:hypothetical protein